MRSDLCDDDLRNDELLVAGPRRLLGVGAISAVANRIAAGLTRSLNQRVHRIGDLNFQLQTLDIVAQGILGLQPRSDWRRGTDEWLVERRDALAEFPCWALAASASSREELAVVA